MWAEVMEEGHRDPQWRTHVTDDDGRELSISYTALKQTSEANLTRAA
jgi:hypothetical protein